MKKEANRQPSIAQLPNDESNSVGPVTTAKCTSLVLFLLIPLLTRVGYIELFAAVLAAAVFSFIASGMCYLFPVVCNVLCVVAGLSAFLRDFSWQGVAMGGVLLSYPIVHYLTKRSSRLNAHFVIGTILISWFFLTTGPFAQLRSIL